MGSPSKPASWPRRTRCRVTRRLTNSRFASKYSWEKPNDRRALDLMNDAAKAVVTEMPDLVVAYGISDEYSFIFHKTCTLFERRER